MRFRAKLVIPMLFVSAIVATIYVPPIRDIYDKVVLSLHIPKCGGYAANIYSWIGDGTNWWQNILGVLWLLMERKPSTFGNVEG